MLSLSFAYAQGGQIVINNYTAADFHTRITAANLLSPGCYFYVALENPELIIPSGSSVSYSSYNIPGTVWKVSTSPTNTFLRLGTHPSLMSGGAISNNTKWVMSQFQFYQSGTPLSSGSVGDISYTCNPVQNVVQTTEGTVEWFTITAGATSTYVQMY